MTDSKYSEVIGGYELVRPLGRGGMAEVWVARKQVGDKGSKYVAIKLIAEHFLGDARYTRMFRAEAELAAALNHANIVQVFEHGEDAGRSFLVMELVDGLNLLKLEERLAYVDERRRFRLASYIIGQLLHALHYAHRIRSADGHPMGVVHRDVSPQNVLVSNSGEVKLTDFGVAHHNFEESSGMHVKGKVRYMPPEQLSGQSRSATVDLYAVGALLHEMLDGRKFRGAYEDGQDLFTVVLSGQVPLLARKAPPELELLRRRLLERDATRRIQAAEEALALLRRFPGYGDAREELAKLCGSSTGVLVPCVAPQRSSPMAAADNATEPHRALASAEPKRPPAGRLVPPPPPVSRGSSRSPTGVTTAVRGLASSEPPASGAWRTGHTEIIAFRALADGATGDASATWRGASEPGLTPPGESLVPAAGVGHPGHVHFKHTGASAEARCVSATDHDILLPAVVGDGTVTAHDGPPVTFCRAAPKEIRPMARSAVTLFGLLGLVATISTVMTWWIVEGARDARAPIVSASPEPSTESLPSLQHDTKDRAESVPAAEPASGVVLAQGTGLPEPKREHDGSASKPEDVGAAVSKRATASASGIHRPAKAAPRKVEVKVASSSGLETAQVRIGSTVLSAGSGLRKISSGTRLVQWRRFPGEVWRPYKKHDFEAGRRWSIHVSKSGPQIFEASGGS